MAQRQRCRKKQIAASLFFFFVRGNVDSHFLTSTRTRNQRIAPSQFFEALSSLTSASPRSGHPYPPRHVLPSAVARFACAPGCWGDCATAGSSQAPHRLRAVPSRSRAQRVSAARSRLTGSCPTCERSVRVVRKREAIGSVPASGCGGARAGCLVYG
jgi:hypothetical protein